MRKRYVLSGVLCVVAVLILAHPSPAPAQTGNGSANQQQNSNVPNAQLLLALVRSVMIAIDNGMTTGNFTVLRDLGTPRFSSMNTPTDLGVAFKGLMDQNISFKATAVTTPTLTTAPFIDENNSLVLEGKFPTRPLEIQFRMSFRVFERQWRLSTLNVNTAEAPPQAESNGNGQQE